MDPYLQLRDEGLSRLPRTRGDGPWSFGHCIISRQAPPHTRGWTPTGARISSHSAGSPAHAGMDPRRESVVGPGRGLPRTRGDGPEREDGLYFDARAPPHTRGWTPGKGRHRRHRGRLPRTRGDGPGAPGAAGADGAAPPHTRGWTRGDGRTVPVHRGSPAHAGMDPRQRDPAADRLGLPRTRGDGPWMDTCRLRGHAGSPATRGDGPWI